MSLSYLPLDRVRVTDPRVDFSQKGIYAITDSAALITYQKIPATNFTGNVLKFAQPISASQALSSKMYVRCEFEVTLSGIPDPGTSLYQIGHDAPRFMPLAAITDNAVLMLNGTSCTLQTNWLIDALMRYENNFEMIGKELSTFPSMFDYYQQYSDYLQYGSGLNSLAQIGEAGPGIEGRGGFPMEIDDSNPNSVKIKFITMEPVVLPPLVWTKENHKSLIGVKNIDLTYNIGDFSRVWSRSETNSTPVVVSARISNTPELCYILQTPKMIDKIPKINIYPYTYVEPQIQNFGTVQPGQSISISFNARQLTGVPSKAYFFGKNADKTPFTTDTYFALEAITQFQFDNFNSVFSSCTPQQLYQICAENGYEGSFSDWYKYSGSVMCVDFSKDVPMQEYCAVGTAKNIQFQVSAVMKNISNAPANLSVYMILCYDGICAIDQNGATTFQINLLTPDDVISSQHLQALPYTAIKDFAQKGGSFSSALSSLPGFLKKTAQKAIGAYDSLSPDTKSMIQEGVTDALAVASPGLSKVVKDFGPEAYKAAKKLVGLGFSENAIYQLLSKNASKGGKKITQKQLKAIARG